MDSAWMIKKWKEMQGRPFDIIAERESIYKVVKCKVDIIKCKFSTQQYMKSCYTFKM
jgi:hypothetical protein